MHRYKEIDVIIGHINMYVRFYICDISAPILGNRSVHNNVELYIAGFKDSYIEQTHLARKRSELELVKI